jgi:hypothetical protein
MAAPDEGTTWLLLSAVYHRVRARMPTDRAAQIAIAEARRGGRLRMRAELRVHEARPDLCLALGEKPPAIQPNIIPDYLILSTDVFQKWDWEYSRATRWDEKTRTLFEYVNIVVHRDNAFACWPELAAPAAPTAATVDPPRSEVQAGLPNGSPMSEGLQRPEGVTALVSITVQIIDALEREKRADFTAINQEELLQRVRRRMPERETVPGTRISVGLRTLQLAQAYRRKRDRTS